MGDLKPFDNQLAGLLAALSLARHRKQEGEKAKQPRAAQQKRIQQQKDPEWLALSRANVNS